MDRQAAVDAANKVADHIIGAAKDVHTGLMDLGFPEELEVNADFCEQIDDRMFMCSVCDWACDRDEESDEEGVCDECHDPDRDD